ncbi:MAG: Uma2 family endonuclease [Deinococcota bacterium]|jgi:Uma2 family endonuclease|nr:Uma2 family endonuclease [Deinococcota bacterium]
MSAQVETRAATADELFDMPDDGFRYELVGGELKQMSPPGEEHGIVTMAIGASLYSHVKASGLGRVYAAETGFKLTSNPDTVRASDVAFVSQGRLDERAPGTGYRPEAPDLAVEVVSPSDRYNEVEEKVLEWLEAGTAMVLVVNPKTRTVTMYRSRHDVHVLTEEDVIDGADIVPGWTLPVSDLFV